MNTIKATHNVSISAMNDFYKLIKKILPEGNRAPSSSYLAKKTISTLGLDYKLIHACPNHHILFHGIHANLTNCPECGETRYRPQSKTPRQVSEFNSFLLSFEFRFLH
jgi:hypothetical protein